MSDTGALAPVTVLISENLVGRMPDLAADHPGVTFVPLPVEGGTLTPDYRAADAMFRSVMDEQLFDEILVNAPNLRWIQISAAGFDWMGGPALEARQAEGLVVTRSESSLNITMAEYCIGAMLSMARQFPGHYAAQGRREWVRLMGRDFGGSTVVVFGTGAVGSEIAWRAAALGAEVIGVNRRGTPVTHFARVVDQHSFVPEIAAADYVVLAMPLTPETAGMFGAAQFAAMPNHAGLVNVGRGALTDEAALVAALEAGEIVAAFIDVFVEEPLPSDHPLWTTTNAVVTPHCSFRSERNTERLLADFSSNLRRFRAGEPLHGTMKQPELGY